MKASIAAAGISLVMTGCASQLLSEDKLRLNTSGVLGVQPADVTISNRRDDTMSTYYTATTSAGAKYACVVSGGNFVTLGLTNPPVCNRGDIPPDATSALTGKSNTTPPPATPTPGAATSTAAATSPPAPSATHAPAASPSGRACLANFTADGSFIAGKSYKSWQEHRGVTYDAAFRKTAQAIAGAGWATVAPNKDTGTITASQAVTASRRGSSVPLNVIVQDKGGALIRVDVNFNIGPGQVTPEDSAKTELCKIVEAAGR